jgi:hypothetical protein
MDLDERIKSFSALGETLRNSLYEDSAGNGSDAVRNGRDHSRRDHSRRDHSHRDHSLHLNTLINNQHLHNPWFTPENARKALNAIADELTAENLIRWTSAYPQLKEEIKPVIAGVIMAGNIPLVGFHDFLSVLISGNKLIAKTSSKDSELIIYIGEMLKEINPAFAEQFEFTEGALKGFDVVIATGSNNSSRYFEYYFGKYPNIIRKNRNSVALINGDESAEELEALGADIFSYFGLGCRNVSKIYIPEGYDLPALAKNWESYAGCINHSKYANNYDFNKAVYIVNKEFFHDTGYLLMKEDSKLSSPVSVLYFEKYDSQYAVKQQIKMLGEKIQCIVSRSDIAFGTAQCPHLWDYADAVDTIEFLLKKN